MPFEEIMVQMGVGGAAILALWKINDSTTKLMATTIHRNTETIQRNSELIEETTHAVNSLKTYLEQNMKRTDRQFEEISSIMESERKQGVQELMKEIVKLKSNGKKH